MSSNVGTCFSQHRIVDARVLEFLGTRRGIARGRAASPTRQASVLGDTRRRARYPGVSCHSGAAQRAAFGGRLRAWVMKQVFALFIGGIATPCLALAVLHGQSRSDVLAQAHGYYLFLAQPPNGCEDCNIPLLVTETRLEDLAREERDEQAIGITTYER